MFVLSRSGAVSSSSSSSPVGNNNILIVDVDNCLYCEKELRRKNGIGIESQIVANTHAFGKRHFQLSPEACDELYRTHGSSVEGFRYLLRRAACSDDDGDDDDDDKEALLEKREYSMLQKYYDDVYRPIDMSALLYSQNESTGTSASTTGYSHDEKKRQRHLQQLFQALTEQQNQRIYLASNSPSHHVQKVLLALGLQDIPFAGMLTPDTITPPTHQHGQIKSFPTKSAPNIFYQEILQNHKHCILLDDSKFNIQKAKDECDIHGIQVDHEKTTLETALLQALGCLDNEFTFSDIHYLQDKNRIDEKSINSQVWNDLGKKLASKIYSKEQHKEVLNIVDVGAGLLSMLRLILNGSSKTNPQDEADHNHHKPSLLKNLASDDQHPVQIQDLIYTAYEPNIQLLEGCRATLSQLGFTEKETDVDSHHYEFFSKRHDVNVIVRLYFQDFQYKQNKEDNKTIPDLIVGCCFADLFGNPHELVASLLHHFTINCKGHNCTNNNIKSSQQDLLVYFPITFTGTTQFFPPKPYMSNINGPRQQNDNFMIPSDTMAFRTYANSLEKYHDHNLDHESLIVAMKDYGGNLLSSGPSTWKIDPSQNKYMWNAMMYFFGLSGAPEMIKEGWDAAGWIRRARIEQPSIQVSNFDLLFSIPVETSSDPVPRTDDENSQNSSTMDKFNNESYESTTIVEEILFQSPYKVGKTTKNWKNTANGSHLRSGQVEIKSLYSLISSGTELKIFKGMFDEAALDVNIKEMADETMKYPLAYGYSLVGIVTNCAPDVLDAQELVGRLVFTFSPHSSHVIVDRDSVMLVPDGISARDAIFMPSVETALSIVHDAHVRIGENVAVYGQGLIGLLVNAIISTQQKSISSGSFGTVTVFDTLSDRLAAASMMGASQALLPSEVANAGPFDVSIEVSGNYRALQSAIDYTSNGGRIIVGSWYGNADISLKLGIDFHRSHKVIKTSQVSEIPAELRTLWSKERRFDLTWELVKMLRPSRLITKEVSLDEAQLAYTLLDKGQEIAVAFSY